MSPAKSSSVVSELAVAPPAGPFSGLVICVTGLSKVVREQIKDATERLGGRYTPNLHPKCTHLVVQSLHGRKFEHALKHGLRNGLFVVTVGWFTDSVRRKARLSESLYSIKNIGENSVPMDGLNQPSKLTGYETSCLPVAMHEHARQSNMVMRFPGEYKRRAESTLSGHSLYIDLDISPELQHKLWQVVKAAASEGALFVDNWFIGCNASHVVCEAPSARKYMGHANNLVTPLWVLKTSKEKCMQRLVHMSVDMAQQVGMRLDDAQNGTYGEEINEDDLTQDASTSMSKASLEEREEIVNLAKNGIRKRRRRCMQACQTPLRPITPSSLLDSICWTVSEPISTASIYTDSSSVENANEHCGHAYFGAKGDGNEMESSFINFSRPLTDSEKTELIFKYHFLTILFPVDRFGEVGPSSRTFFSDKGFTCLQVLDNIYTFYQENMSAQEVEVAIHIDSRQADQLRSVYSSKETAEQGCVAFKRIHLLGNRIYFEMLKRVNGDNNSNVYELLIRA
ncbi:uncharacterized protein LOC127813213 isoform X2 [Diospyros lotus]|uniref:uncharacterized protein LOC127813213 isoform X2 n=1 Tax=Diospyros lotus TaxID=55363 RepID=UPI0022585969|nr:uncharacterized protein LOC127813213 isoform X2 [Diospyros lotus]